MTQPILSASSSVTSRPSILASHLPANTRVPPEAISSSRRLDASLWCSEYQSVARSIALLAQYPIAAPIPITRRVPLLCFVMGRPYPYSVGGVVGVSPRLSGRSSLGGGSSLGGTSSARGGAGGTTPPRGGTASTSSSATGEVGALSSLLLLPLPSSHNKSKISVAIASTPQRLATQRYRRLFLRARFFLLRIAPIRFVGRWWPALRLGHAWIFFFVGIVPTCSFATPF